MKKLDINPWFTMFTQPRSTIRKIVDLNPKMGFFYLASIWFLQFFFLFIAYVAFEFPIQYGLALIIAALISPFIGAICFFFFGWLLFISGKWLNGKAKQSQTRCAFAWSRIPVVIDLIMWFVLSAFIAEIVFLKINVGVSFYFTNLIAAITSIWSFVLLVVSIKEIQKFSLLKALISVILSYLFIFSVMLIIMLVFHLFNYSLFKTNCFYYCF